MRLPPQGVKRVMCAVIFAARRALTISDVVGLCWSKVTWAGKRLANMVQRREGRRRWRTSH